MEKFDSEAFYKRLLIFAEKSQKLVSNLPNTKYNQVYGYQLIKSSSSSGANYIEALEALSKKDFVYRLRIARKEVRESVHWLRLIRHASSSLKDLTKENQELITEGREMVKILSSSIITLEKKKQ